MARETSGKPRTLRVFYALWPDKAARAAIHRLAQEVAFDGQGRAPREANLHITIAFVGSVTEARVAELCTIGQHVAAHTPTFPVSLDRIGGTSYGIAWLAPDGVPPALASLHASLQDSLQDAGFAVQQRMFRPHVTLARDCVRAAHRGVVGPIRWRAERLSLEASNLAPGGSEYRTIANWPFRRLGTAR
jgi:2'-5' RNA ligase